MSPNRRSVLRLAGATATAATVGFAGSTAVGARSTVDDLPPYSQWLTIDDGGLEFVAVDWATLEEYVEDELEQAQTEDEFDVPAAFEADPMIVPVSRALLSTYFFVGLTLAPYGLGRFLDDTEFESTPEELLLTDRVFIAVGEIDPEEIDAELTTESEIEFIMQFEQTDEVGDYDVYTTIEDDDQAAIAVDTDALVFADSEAVAESDDSIGILERAIDASTGDTPRASEEAETIEWTLETAGYGDVTAGQYGAAVGDDEQTDDDGFLDLTFEGLEDAEAVVSSLTVEDETTSTGEFAAVIDDPDETALENLLGASGEEQSVTVDEDRVTASATWYEDDLAGE